MIMAVATELLKSIVFGLLYGNGILRPVNEACSCAG
jgi:hypothetical protein